MKSKIRPITVDGSKYNWSVKELDWDNVLLTVWVDGVKNTPWFTTQKKFNNPWHFIGQVKAENMDALQLEPVTPKHVSAAIKLIIKGFGLPDANFKTLEVNISENGDVTKV